MMSLYDRTTYEGVRLGPTRELPISPDGQLRMANYFHVKHLQAGAGRGLRFQRACEVQKARPTSSKVVVRYFEFHTKKNSGGCRFEFLETNP